MKKSFKFSAKKVEDAISDGLSALGVSMDEVEVKILTTGGLFKKAEVEIIIETPDLPEEKPAAKPEEKPAAKPEEKHEAKPKAEEKHEAKPKHEERHEPKPKAEEKPAAKHEERHESKPKHEERHDAKPKAEDKKPQFLKRQEDKNKADKPAPKHTPSGFVKQGAESAGQDGEEKKYSKHRRGEAVPASPETAEKAGGFLKTTLTLMGVEAEIKSDITEGLNLEIVTEDSAVIGHRGETLDALQYLTSLAVNTESGKFVPITLDAFGYRLRRAESLKRLAAKMADKCLKSNRRVSLEPMNSSDRKEIHAFLSEFKGVVTKSEGSEPGRRIVIYPERPANK